MARKTFMRAAHGAGAAAIVRIEQPPADELSAVTVTDPRTVRSHRAPNGRFTAGNTVSRVRRIRAGAHGALAALDGLGDAAWRASAAWGRRYSAHRRAELATAHGHLSAGAAALVDDAANVRADAKYLAAKARAEGNTALSKQAASMLSEAKQLELAAWELASRESATRPTSPLDRWLVTTTTAVDAPSEQKDKETPNK
jgi:hypothetical protein